ncbi:MAG: hypothetical protein IJ532_01170 [Alphaproteobacteria bacterium]|nr:hypothetical protein [Alphaproteobacteria bacterium]
MVSVAAAVAGANATINAEKNRRRREELLDENIEERNRYWKIENKRLAEERRETKKYLHRKESIHREEDKVLNATRLAIIRKKVAHNIDKKLGTDLEEKRIPRFVKKGIEKPVSNIIDTLLNEDFSIKRKSFIVERAEELGGREAVKIKYKTSRGQTLSVSFEYHKEHNSKTNSLAWEGFLKTKISINNILKSKKLFSEERSLGVKDLGQRNEVPSSLDDCLFYKYFEHIKDEKIHNILSKAMRDARNALTRYSADRHVRFDTRYTNKERLVKLFRNLNQMTNRLFKASSDQKESGTEIYIRKFKKERY